MTLEVSLRTFFFRFGKAAQIWIEIRSWTGWRVQKESDKQGTRLWWAWLEVAY